MEPCVAPLSRCGGFTLIELMIVTVIIALLVSIAIPQFDGIRQRAYNTAVLADLNNANKEIERFFNEHYRYPADDGEVPPVAVPLPMLDPEPSVVPGVGAS